MTKKSNKKRPRANHAHNRKTQLRQEQRGFKRRDAEIRNLVKQEMQSAARKQQAGHRQACKRYCEMVADPHNAEAMNPIFDSEHLRNVQEAGTVHLRKTLSVQAWETSGNEGQFDFGFNVENAIYSDHANICYSSANRTSGGSNFYPAGTLIGNTNVKCSLAAFPSPWKAQGANPGDLHSMPVCASVRFVPTTQVIARNGAWVGGPSPEDDSKGAFTRLFDQLADYKFAETGDAKHAFAVTWIAGEGQDYTSTTAALVDTTPNNLSLWAAWRGSLADGAVTWIATIDVIYYVWGSKSGATEQVLRIPNLLACVSMAYGDNSTNQVVSSENIQKALTTEKKTFVATARKEMSRILSTSLEAVSFADVVSTGAKLFL